VREAYGAATLLRPSIVFGSEDRFFNLFAGFARLSPVLPLYGGGTTRFQPVYAGDVAAACVAALEGNDTPAQIYELGGPVVATFAELMALMLAQIGRPRLLVPVPLAVGLMQAAMFEMVPSLLLAIVQMPRITRDMLRQLMHDNVVGDNMAGLAELGVAPTAMELVLPGYLARYRRGGRIGRTQPA